MRRPELISRRNLNHCKRCGYDWLGHNGNTPLRCAKCRSPYWQEPKRRITYKKKEK